MFDKLLSDTVGKKSSISSSGEGEEKWHQLDPLVSKMKNKNNDKVQLKFGRVE